MKNSLTFITEQVKMGEEFVTIRRAGEERAVKMTFDEALAWCEAAAIEASTSCQYGCMLREQQDGNSSRVIQCYQISRVTLFGSRPTLVTTLDQNKIFA